VSYPLIACAVALWFYGLSDQALDPMRIAKYIIISLVMIAVALI
jgi:hypothetical protein